MKPIRELAEFERSFINTKEEEKLVMIVSIDGGSNENLRYEKTISCAVDYFSIYNLDAFFARNVPGHSAFNTVKRRKASLSKDLGGVLFEHEHSGVHVEEKGNSIGPQLELKNFEHARKILDKI